MKLLFISLGCDKNLVDSEYMIGMLTSHGITLTDDETEADIIIVNSCCFIGDAKEESINTILEMAEQKKTGVCKSLIVTGCLSDETGPFMWSTLIAMPSGKASLNVTITSYLNDSSAVFPSFVFATVK